MKPATLIAILFLDFVATMHLLRLVFQVPISIGSTEVPMWPSVIAVLGAGMLAVWLWRDSRQGVR